VRPFLVALVLLVAGTAPAFAQIYSWRDAEGLLVVSDRPRADQGEMTTYTVPRARRVLATTPTSRKGRSAEFDEAIEHHASAQGVSPELVRAVIQVESAFNSRAVSSKGAMGLMQLMPATARELGVVNPFHPDENIRGGVAYLRQLLDRYDSNVELALAAYNAGPASVEKYQAVPPYRETQDYVRKITGATAAPPAPPSNVIYKWVEIVGGRPMTRYSNKPPAGVGAEPVGRK
jgi:soluble lytic murein transglycosylase-like protein